MVFWRYPFFVFVLFLTIASGCRILVPQPGIKPAPLAVKARSPKHGLPKNSQGIVLYSTCLYHYIWSEFLVDSIYWVIYTFNPWINLFFNWYIQTTYIYCNYWYIRAYESFFVFCLFPLFSILLCPFSCPSMDYVYIFFEFHFHISLVFWDVSLCIVFFCSWSSYYTHTYKHIYVILQSTSASILLLCLCGM